MSAQRGSGGRNRLWSARLWILAAGLGATTTYFMVSAVHDDGRARAAVHLVAQSMAVHIASVAESRLQLLVGQAFSPISSGTPQSTSDELVRLAEHQRRGTECSCREMLPVGAFFRFDPVTRSVTVVHTDDAPPFRTHAGDTTLRDVVIKELQRRRSHGTTGVSVKADSVTGQIVAVVQTDTTSSSHIPVYGFTANTRRLLATVFRAHAGMLHGPRAGLGLAHLDSMSLRVASGDSNSLFGALSDDRTHRATVVGTGTLAGLAITVALKRSQMESPLAELMPRRALWGLGVLMLSTLIVMAIAIGTSRRELLLARARSDFVAGVSHDLRMPLAQILLAGETLSMQRAQNPSEQTALSGSIVREARRLMVLVDNVLLFSRPGSAAPAAHAQPVAVDALFADVIDSVQLAVNDAGQTIAAAPAAEFAVLADRTLIRQALVNLVDNAIKYGGASQRIQLGATRTAAGRVRLYVDDRGPGVPTGDRERLFDAYERLARDQVSERTGAGLGLAVVRQVARACGGAAMLDDAPGGGTRAVIELRSASLS